MCGHTHSGCVADLPDGHGRLFVLPAWRETQAGYWDRDGELAPVRFAPDGVARPAGPDGLPA
jgi:hypothetical protein